MEVTYDDDEEEEEEQKPRKSSKPSKSKSKSRPKEEKEEEEPQEEEPQEEEEEEEEEEKTETTTAHYIFERPTMPPIPDDSNVALISVFLLIIVLIALSGLVWKLELHKKLFRSSYDTVAGG